MLQVNVKSSSQRLLGYSIDKEPLSSKQHIDYSERLDDRWIFKSLPIPFSVAVSILKKRLVWRIKMHFYDWIIQYNTTVEFRLKTRKASLDYLIQYNVWISFQNKEKTGFSFCSNFQFCRKRKGTYLIVFRFLFFLRLHPSSFICGQFAVKKFIRYRWNLAVFLVEGWKTIVTQIHRFSGHTVIFDIIAKSEKMKIKQ